MLHLEYFKHDNFILVVFDDITFRNTGSDFPCFDVLFYYDDVDKLTGFTLFNFSTFNTYKTLSTNLITEELDVDIIDSVIKLIKDKQQEIRNAAT
jgi:hypothetical protein